MKLRILGAPQLPRGEHEFEFPGRTLADVRKHLAGIYGSAPALERVLIGLVNGKAAGRDWERVVLSEGDSVMLIVPISGG